MQFLRLVHSNSQNEWNITNSLLQKKVIPLICLPKWCVSVLFSNDWIFSTFSCYFRLGSKVQRGQITAFTNSSESIFNILPHTLSPITFKYQTKLHSVICNHSPINHQLHNTKCPKYTELVFVCYSPYKLCNCLASRVEKIIIFFAGAFFFAYRIFSSS